MPGDADRIIFHSLAEKSGPAAARNEGVRHARSSMVLFIDSDVLVPVDFFARLDEAIVAHPGADAIVGSYDAEPADPAFLSQYRNLLHHYVHQHADPEMRTFWTGCGLVRRGVFLEAGGFDEARFARPCIEDVEFGLRLVDAGKRIRLEKSLQVTHLKHWSARGILRTDLLDRAVPWSALLLGRGSVGTMPNVGVRERLSVAAAGLLGISLLAAPFLYLTAATGALIGLGMMLACNAGFYMFLVRLRGPAFALMAVPWHVVHYFECGMGLLIAISGGGRLNKNARTIRSGDPSATCTCTTSSSSEPAPPDSPPR